MDRMKIGREIALLQQDLLLQRFDPETLSEIPLRMVRKSLFRKEYPQEWLDTRRRLEEKKKQLSALTKDGGKDVVRWWELPWEKLEPVLLYNLTLPQEDDSFSFSRELLFGEKEGARLLFLHEEGHISDFDSDRDTVHETTARYSAEETKRRQQELDDSQSAVDFDLLLHKGGLHSTMTGLDYESGNDYLLSTEHWNAQQSQRDDLERELYHRSRTDSVTVHSRSTHYDSLYLVSEFGVDEEGILLWIRTPQPSLVRSTGGLPQAIREYYEGKSSQVWTAFHLVHTGSISGLDPRLAKILLESEETSEEGALFQSALLTCLAETL